MQRSEWRDRERASEFITDDPAERKPRILTPALCAQAGSWQTAAWEGDLLAGGMAPETSRLRYLPWHGCRRFEYARQPHLAGKTIPFDLS